MFKFLNYFHFNPNHKNISVLEYAIRKYSKINEENKDKKIGDEKNELKHCYPYEYVLTL